MAIGTSAGGVEALLFRARHFPADFPTSVLVTIHLPSRFRSALDDLLNAAGPLRARFAEDGEQPRNGHIYIAPPAHVAVPTQLPPLLDELVRQKAGEPVTVPEAIRMEVEIARHGGAGIDAMERIGERSVFPCPDRARTEATRSGGQPRASLAAGKLGRMRTRI